MEAYGLYRGRHIFGLGVPHAVVATGQFPDERVFVERFLLLKNKPLVSSRTILPPAFYSEVDDVLKDGLEGILAEIEGAWLELSKEKRCIHDLGNFGLRSVPRGQILWIKRDHPTKLEEVRAKTLCRKLQSDLDGLLPLEFDHRPI